MKPFNPLTYENVVANENTFTPVPKPKKLSKEEKSTFKFLQYNKKQQETYLKIKQKLRLKKQKARAKKAKSPSALKKKCDFLFSKIIRLRDGKCLKCGSTQNLQCAHIASRKHLAGRWNEENAITLCYKDHFYFAHKEPVAFSDWLRENHKTKYLTAITVIGEIVPIINYEVLLDQLTERLKELSI